MRTLLGTSALLAALLISPTVAADSWYSSFGYRSGFDTGFSRHRDWRDFRRHRPYAVRSRYGYDYNYGYGYRPYRYRSSGFNFHFGNSRRHYRAYRHDVDAGVLLGGVVLGSLLSHSWHDAREKDLRTVRYSSRPLGQRRQLIYVKDSPRQPPTPRRRLLRDLRGNCFEITRSSGGDELRRQLDPAACDF